MSKLGFDIRLTGVAVPQAVEQVTKALAQEGFGVLTTIDVSQTFKKKLDIEFSPYVILGACNPGLAKRALDADPAMGLLLPCNVVVRQVEGGVEVSIADPHAMFQVVDDPRVAPLAEDAALRLRRVKDSLATQA
ncbi:MAG: DUF302 domain-containing protein [Myxococcales bacterium]|nr:DUF302 domain-containing protein [Myxococcales bacterium]